MSFLLSKRPEILLKVRECKSVVDLSWACKCTHSHVHKSVLEFERLGFVETKKSSRFRFVKLTSLGKTICTHLRKIKMIMEND